jgi:hypothetical protein
VPVSIYRVSGTAAKEPRDWVVDVFADIGGSEEFLQQLVMQMPELVDASSLLEPSRREIKQAILIISFEGLMHAFEHLKKIRAAGAQTIPALNKKQLYEDFTGALRVAYWRFAQKAAKLICADVGFVFGKNASFDRDAITFNSNWPSAPAWLGPYLREQRAAWQNDLSDFRNFLQHGNPTADYSDHYRPARGEALFDAVWRTVANILAALIGMHLGALLVEIPANERSPINPRRFRFALEGLSSPKEFGRAFSVLGPMPVA